MEFTATPQNLARRSILLVELMVSNTDSILLQNESQAVEYEGCANLHTPGHFDWSQSSLPGVYPQAIPTLPLMPNICLPLRILYLLRSLSTKVSVVDL